MNFNEPEKCKHEKCTKYVNNKYGYCSVHLKTACKKCGHVWTNRTGARICPPCRHSINGKQNNYNLLMEI